MESPRMSMVLLLLPAILPCFLCPLCYAIESPQFTVVHSESDFEIRLYRVAAWMSAPVKDISFEKATRNGFHRYPHLQTHLRFWFYFLNFHFDWTFKIAHHEILGIWYCGSVFESSTVLRWVLIGIRWGPKIVKKSCYSIWRKNQFLKLRHINNQQWWSLVSGSVVIYIVEKMGDAERMEGQFIWF